VRQALNKKMCVFIFYTTLSEKFYIIRRIPSFSSDFNATWTVLTESLKNAQISNFMRIHLVGNDLFHADGRTDMNKLTEAFRNLAKALKNKLFISVRTHSPQK